jgi:hypothetical protein
MMTPQSEKELVETLTLLRNAIMDNAAFSAYPQLLGPMCNIGAHLDNLTHQLIKGSREEMLYGTSLGAKVYELVTGRSLSIPKGIIETDRVDRYWSNTSLTEICKYKLLNRPGAAKGHTIVNGDETLFLDVNTQKAMLTFVKSDMSIVFNEIDTTKATIHCALFEEPYELYLDRDWARPRLFDELFEAVVGDEALEPFDEKYMFMNHYFGTLEERKEVAEDAPINKLIKILYRYEYGSGLNSYFETEFNGYKIRFDTVADWGHWSGGHVFKISSVRKIQSNGDIKSIGNWSGNPLFVRDILGGIDKIIEAALAEYDRQRNTQEEEE